MLIRVQNSAEISLGDKNKKALSQFQMMEHYLLIRKFTEDLCEPLAIEDFVIQSMPDVSPTRWHLAHTTWFFETFILTPTLNKYIPFHEKYRYLFNSYYNAVGDQHCRDRRGILSRPTVKEIYKYRKYVDEAMIEILSHSKPSVLEKIIPAFDVGLNHEQQHQELMFTDIKHVFSCNPLRPIYKKTERITIEKLQPMEWIQYPEKLYFIGHEGNGFAFDNEGPNHKVYLNSFKIASRLVTNGEYLAFMDDHGYERPELWLSDGWNAVKENNLIAPLYWEKNGVEWWHMTLSGMHKVEEDEPVCHVSFYEADAFARWAGKRLLSEPEWEVVARQQVIDGNFVEWFHLNPIPLNHSKENQRPFQLFGDVWEWTNSPYLGYPGYRPVSGALGEYNGKFMSNQIVLRGGSCVTSKSHIRATYRNFFAPQTRWQFSGIPK